MWPVEMHHSSSSSQSAAVPSGLELSAKVQGGPSFLELLSQLSVLWRRHSQKILLMLRFTHTPPPLHLRGTGTTRNILSPEFENIVNRQFMKRPKCKSEELLIRLRGLGGYGDMFFNGHRGSRPCDGQMH